MKKQAINIIAILGIVAFSSSCKKDRVCECTLNSMVVKYTIKDATTRQAKDICVTKEYENNSGGITVKYTVNCTLK